MGRETDSKTAGRILRLALDDRRTPAFDGAVFGSAGTYDWLNGRAFCAIDPDHPLNAGIVNLDRAPRNAAGLVEYEVDVALLTPSELARGNGWLFYELVNRGGKRCIHRINDAPPVNLPATTADLGNGYLLNEGYSLLWTAWQGDALPGKGRLQARFPVPTDGGRPIIGPCTDEIIADGPGSVRDEVIQELDERRFVATLSYAAADLDPAKARLTVRQQERDPRQTPPDLAWRYLDDRRVEITRPDPARFDRGAIYEFVFPARDPVVMGIGLASIRDLVHFFRTAARDEAGNANPLAPQGRPLIRRALGIGLSQSGRALRDFVYQGFNDAGGGRAVFDAVVPVIAGSRRAFVNAAFAQTSRYPRQHEDHWYPGDQFPFAYRPMTDPISGRTDGILERARAAGVCPKVMHVDTESEIWSARASLVVTDCEGRDIAQPDDVRVYLAAGVPHGSYQPPSAEVVERPSNPLTYGWLLRALLPALRRWVETGEAPPPSCFPSRAAGTLVTLAEAAARFPAIPGGGFPTVMNEVQLRDHTREPPVEGPTYPSFVVAPDADGNPGDGVLHPVIQAALATYTGWNRRRKGYAEGALYSIAGSRMALPRTAMERQAAGDPRPSIEERYGDRAGYLRRLRAACDGLVERRLLRAEDADLLVAAAEAEDRDLDNVI